MYLWIPIRTDCGQLRSDAEQPLSSCSCPTGETLILRITTSISLYIRSACLGPCPRVQQVLHALAPPHSRVSRREVVASSWSVWSEFNTLSNTTNLRRLTKQPASQSWGAAANPPVATPSDTDNSTLSLWGGSPLFLSAFVDERWQSALDPREGISTKARVFLQHRTCVNTRGVPLFYNRLHFLTKTAAQSIATPLAYDRDHIPSNSEAMGCTRSRGQD